MAAAAEAAGARAVVGDARAARRRCPRAPPTAPPRPASPGTSTGCWRSTPAASRSPRASPPREGPLARRRRRGQRRAPAGAAAAALRRPLREPPPAAARPHRRPQPRARPRTPAARAACVLLASLALQLAACAALFVGVVQPARRRIDAWMARGRRGGPREPLPPAARPADRHAQRRLLPRPPRPARRRRRPRAPRRPRCSASTSTASRCCARRSAQRTGDEVLRLAARRIRKALRAGDFAAYLGQDDFVVVAGELDEANDAAMIAARVQAALVEALLDPRRRPADHLQRRRHAPLRRPARTPSGRSPTPRSRSPRPRPPAPAACATSARTCAARSSGARRSSPS